MGSPTTEAAFRLYDAGWSLALPLLRLHSRLQDGYQDRIGRRPLPRTDIWIQAASGGEAYLACELVKELIAPPTPSILLTTNTRQGMEVLSRAADALPSTTAPRKIHTAFFPFDHSKIMASALHTARPGIIVLLESEMWPGMMRAAGDLRCPTIIVNGRMTPRSLKRYRLLPSLWRNYRPETILAISERDAARFAELFGGDVAVMNNIKFDRLRLEADDATAPHRLDTIIPADATFIVLGSIRKEEEPDVIDMLAYLRQNTPRSVIGLVPRHLHRLPEWRRRLAGQPAEWALRSAIETPVPEGTIILWDTFGELDTAYSRCDAAFVGGSLARLGGQNFLEPLMWGVTPVIGPHWDNFAWVGRDIFEHGLAFVGNDWQAVAAALVAGVQHPKDKRQVRRAVVRYLKRKQGGTQQACRHIRSVLARSQQIRS